MTSLKIGIVGGGYVGSATSLFVNSWVQVYIYDIDPSKRNPTTTSLNDIIMCDLIFICVPTPSLPNGSCNISIVESVVSELLKLKPNLDCLIVRSTVPPGTCRKLGTHFMPEFLTEKNWQTDFVNRSTWIFGLNPDKNSVKIQSLCESLIHLAHQDKRIASNLVKFVALEEAECAKYVRNCFLACKVAFFNEIYEYCSHLGLNYEMIRQLTIEDDRIGASHTQVPGHNGKFGFGGTCFPKDLSAFISEFRSRGLKANIMEAADERNRRDSQRDI
jgi:nucleotide sugar dehydrogenase